MVFFDAQGEEEKDLAGEGHGFDGAAFEDPNASQAGRSANWSIAAQQQPLLPSSSSTSSVIDAVVAGVAFFNGEPKRGFSSASETPWDFCLLEGLTSTWRVNTAAALLLTLLLLAQTTPLAAEATASALSAVEAALPQTTVGAAVALLL